MPSVGVPAQLYESKYAAQSNISRLPHDASVAHPSRFAEIATSSNATTAPVDAPNGASALRVCLGQNDPGTGKSHLTSRRVRRANLCRKVVNIDVRLARRQ
jgi:hypothetical protein